MQLLLGLDRLRTREKFKRNAKTASVSAFRNFLGRKSRDTVVDI